MKHLLLLLVLGILALGPLTVAEVTSAEIHGTKWVDTNGDGQWDPGEPGVAGVTIYLDLNNNSVSDANEPRTTTMADDPNTGLDEAGMYWLSGLPAGTYIVSEVIPSGYTQTFPGGDGSHAVTVESGETVENVDFGNWTGPTPVEHTTWGEIKLQNLNRDNNDN